MKNVLAFDLGASSGRGILGSFDGAKLNLKEVHRFPHNFTTLNDHAYWDALYLYEAMKETLSKCPKDLSGMAFDTWGVDCGLIDKNKNLINMPLSYRDSGLDDDNMEEVLKLCGGEKKMFENTGIASLAYNTVYKLYYIRKHFPYQFEAIDKVLFMPNLFAFLFCGDIAAEYSIASTSQLLDMKTAQWSDNILNALDFSKSVLPEVVYSGRIAGNLTPEIASAYGLNNAKVITVSGHDTACACSAVPASEKEYTFLSSGTWSLMGIATENMLTGEQVIKDKISNEGTYDGGYRPTVNIIGLWIVQQLRRNFKDAGKDYDFATLADMAENHGISDSFINPDDFMQEGNYPEKIRNFCKETGQRVPETDAELMATVLTSLAMKYRQVYDSFKPYIHWEEKVYMIGGGINNKVLCQFSANALGVPVITGASEATAAGNIMQQLKAVGEYNSESDKSRILIDSFGSKIYEPCDTGLWESAYDKYKQVVIR